MRVWSKKLLSDSEGSPTGMLLQGSADKAKRRLPRLGTPGVVLGLLKSSAVVWRVAPHWRPFQARAHTGLETHGDLPLSWAVFIPRVWTGLLLAGESCMTE